MANGELNFESLKAVDPQGNVVIYDPSTNEWIPVGPGAQQIMRADPVTQTLAGFLEGATGGLSLLDVALPGDPGFGAGAQEEAPIATGVGFASTFAQSGVRAGIKGIQLVRGMGLGAGGRSLNNVRQAGNVGDALAAARAGTLGVTKQFKNRGLGLVEDAEPSLLRRTTAAFKNLGQNLVEKSQILRGIAGKRSPNIARQFETNIWAATGARAKGSDLTRAGGISRAGAGRIAARNDEQFTAALIKDDGLIQLGNESSFITKKDALARINSTELDMFRELFEQNQMTARQLFDWRRQLSGLTRSSNISIRSRAGELITELDEIAKRTPHIDEVLWEQAQETWRFVETMLAGLGKEAGNVSFPAYKAKALEMFPSEMRKAQEGQRALSDVGNRVIRGIQDIEFQGGVMTPADQISAIDFILAGTATGAVGGTAIIGSGVFR